MSLRPSLRLKITLGYYIIGTLIVGLSFFAFIELNVIDEKIWAGDSISRFFDTTLEIRRFEKNYFLYHQPVDREEFDNHVAKAENLMRENERLFASLVGDDVIARFKNEIDRYSRLMSVYASTGAVEREKLVTEIRISGKRILEMAEQIARAERETLHSLLRTHRRNLGFSIVLLIMLVITAGRALSRMVTRPLKLIEENMESVARGRLGNISSDFTDSEIVSLTTAFNHVISALELRQKYLLRSEKLAALGTLLSGVAHELNNPLSNISTSCQILIEDINNADIEFRKEMLDQIDDQTNRARNIVRSLLNFARERGFRKEPARLWELFDETIRFMKAHIPTDVSITINVPQDIVISADKQRLQQAFINLVKNGVDALQGEGDIVINAIRREPLEQPDDSVTEKRFHGKMDTTGEVVDIEIHDNGTGIDPEVAPRIFDPFFTTKEVGLGSGLGLFIVHEIIEEHGGNIVVESEKGSGTTFFIRLPI